MGRAARKPRRTFAGALAALALASTASVGTIFALACNDPAPVTGPCNTHPFDCAANETCWPNASSSGFACLAAGQGIRGDACQLVAGQPSCAPELICIMPPGTSTGVCAIYCDPKDERHACPAGETCSAFQLDKSGGALSACAAPPAG